jgi:hypothetical protein
MQTKSLVIIDIQNDITKHYKDIIGNINAAIDSEQTPVRKNSRFWSV